MTNLTIRTTCHGCQLTFAVSSTVIVLELPAPSAEPEAVPSLVHVCPGCLACDRITVTWRTAAYLLDAGASTVTAPDAEQIRPRYPERRPLSTRPMGLDDLIDLHTALDRGLRGV